MSPARRTRPRPWILARAAHAALAAAAAAAAASQALAAGSLGFGPSVAANFPHPANAGLEIRLPSQRFTLAAGGGYLPPLHFKVGADKIPVSVSTGNFDVRGRFHPFVGAFFMGVALGRQWLTGSGTQTIDAGSGVMVPTKVTARVDTYYVAPHLGWLWGRDHGLFFGFDLGLQVGFGSSSKLDVSIEDPAYSAYLSQVQSTSSYTNLKNKTQDGLDRLGNTLLPFVTALRIGWMF